MTPGEAEHASFAFSAAMTSERSALNARCWSYTRTFSLLARFPAGMRRTRACAREIAKQRPERLVRRRLFGSGGGGGVCALSLEPPRPRLRAVRSALRGPASFAARSRVSAASRWSAARSARFSPPPRRSALDSRSAELERRPSRVSSIAASVASARSCSRVSSIVLVCSRRAFGATRASGGGGTASRRSSRRASNGAVDVLETEARLPRVALERGDAARRVVAFAAEGGERGGVGRRRRPRRGTSGGTRPRTRRAALGSARRRGSRRARRRARGGDAEETGTRGAPRGERARRASPCGARARRSTARARGEPGEAIRRDAREASRRRDGGGGAKHRRARRETDDGDAETIETRRRRGDARRARRASADRGGAAEARPAKRANGRWNEPGSGGAARGDVPPRAAPGARGNVASVCEARWSVPRR